MAEALLVARDTSAARGHLAYVPEHGCDGLAAPEVRFLRAIADALDGDIGAGEEAVRELVQRTARRREMWSFTELEVFLETAGPRGDITPEAAEAIGRWIAQLKPLWGPEPDQGG
jgi:hypothetical protein